MPNNLVRSLFGLLVPAGLLAQEIPPADYSARRNSLAAHIDSGVVVAFGAPNPVGIRRWTQLAAFQYLTGFLEPNAVFVLVKRGGTSTGMLFTASRDPRRALYDGFVQVIPGWWSESRVSANPRRGKHELPTPVGCRVGIFPFQRRRQGHVAETF